MVLSMSRPFRHPVTGIYWFRKRVPEALRATVGKLEEKCSLKTRDPMEAKVAHARVAAEVEERWQRLRAGPQSLSQRQAEAVAGEIYRSMLAEHGDDPDKVTGGVTALLIDKAFVNGSAKIVSAGADVEKSAAMIEKMRTSRNAKRIDAWLSSRGWLLTPESRELVRKAVDRAILQAREQLYRMSGGDYRADPEANRFPKLEEQRKSAGDKSFHIMRVFDEYAAEGKLAPSTIKKWRPIMASIAAEVPDIRNLTREWCLAWKDKQVARKIAMKSVRLTYIGSLRAMCEWAVNNDRIPENPALRIQVKVEKQTRKRGYTDAEATTILRASLEPMSDRTGPKHKAARRWIPMLCAYTGARVGEIAQLRKQDVRKVDGVWLIRITPDAGSVKTGRTRDVAIHPELLRQKFTDFVSQSSGALFYNKPSPRGGSDSNPTYKKTGEWIAKWIRNDLKITDKDIAPSHAWRHRFKTIARRVKMDTGARDYMQGHAAANEGEGYGTFEPAMLFDEISKLPVIDVHRKKSERG
jgi:integrase